MMASCASRSAVTDTTAGKRLPSLRIVGQLVDVLDAARGLEDQRLEAGRDRRAELDAERLGARDHFLRIGDVGRRDLVHHLGGRVAQHPLGADVEDLDDALRVGGDAREVGAVEDRALQSRRFKQGRRMAPVDTDRGRLGKGFLCRRHVSPGPPRRFSGMPSKQWRQVASSNCQRLFASHRTTDGRC